MNTDRARHAVVLSCCRQPWLAPLATVCAIVLAGGLALAGSPAAAHVKSRAKLKYEETKHVSMDPFGKIPKGPLQLIISVDQQKLHLYSDGREVADTLVATGVPDHPTPTGVFSVIQKSRRHRSNIYSQAPMPYMQRITWSGVAIHEGVGVGHPASHGCVRMLHEFAAHLWTLTKLGARVIIARPELRPQEFADPHLFVHKEKPAALASIASTSAAVEPIKTRQTGDRSKTTDADVASTPSASIGDTPDKGPAGAAAAGPVNGEKGAPAAVAAEVPKTDKPFGTATAIAAAVAAAVPVPESAPKPPEMPRSTSRAPIAVFVSLKEKRIYVRQNFSPLFDAPIAIDHPEQPLGTHVFTALEYLDDGTSLRWNVVSLPGERPQTSRNTENAKKSAEAKYRDERAADPPLPDPPPQTPKRALARIQIPQQVIDQISQMIVPGSSLIVSDHGLGSETGEGTNFIVITH